MKLAAATYLVRDYDEAIKWLRDALNFKLLEDTKLTDERRWVRMAPSNASTSLLLAKVDTVDQRASVGKAAGGRVAYFLHTNDFKSEHARMLTQGVGFLEEPRNETYGTVAVFLDLYGNKWDLIEPAKRHI